MIRTLPSPPEPELVVDQDRLEELCRTWIRQPAIALDSEFVRTRTFYARLGLIQVGDADGCYLLDVPAIDSWEPVIEVLTAPGTVKVLHSPSEDLEIFQQFFGHFPSPLFDTQIAATLAGLGASLGYQRLVDALFGISLPKGEQRSDWMARPLSRAQCRYAGLDVAYLLPAYEQLDRRLRELGRRDWAEEEFSRVPDETVARLDPERIFSRLHRPSMSEEETAVLHALCMWRESEARRRDLPRGFVLRDEALIELARRQPHNRTALKTLRKLRPGDRKSFGDQLLEVIASASRAPVPPRLRTPRGLGRNRKLVDRLRQVLSEEAERLDLPPEFLASRKVLEDLARRLRGGAGDELPAELTGWRREAAGDRLLSEGRAALGR
ncbi:MAG TPA: ribonuclease D [Thermoanaerobaculia bacterium]|nr:ribonuclease D [Thermoanaerobaculia bacterium]